MLRNHFAAPTSSLRNRHFAAKSFRSLRFLFAKIFAAANRPRGTRVPFGSTLTSFRSCETAVKSQSVKTPNFAANAPFRREFHSCETTLWHTSAISQHCTLISQLKNGCEMISKLRNGCERIFKLRNGCEMISKLRNGCEMISKLRNGYEMISKLRNGLQVAKWPSSCEIDLQNGGRFAKTPCKAKRNVTTSEINSVVYIPQSTVMSDVVHANLSAFTDANELGNSPSSSVDANKSPSIAFGTGNTSGHPHTKLQKTTAPFLQFFQRLHHLNT
ncbi:hypothetical protein VitviT2T_014666 [Vitis vinifera]|uniref:Uncharacterized protein n=1 Tax=Vitis vinifera TaxID=29760 RepID=A0ABY9CMN9_VITVI|nr:hypothetical protein VitviT2T_014666 [Vitis vinifera]